MKRLLVAGNGLVLMGLALALGAARGQGQNQGTPGLPPGFGPAEGGAVLRQPWEATAKPAGAHGDLPEFARPGPLPLHTGNPDQKNSVLERLKPREGPDPNQDILVTPAYGPWMICVTSYSGDEAHQMARELVMELRNHYRVNAYVYNKGEQDRREEYQRVKEELERRREIYRKNNVPDTIPIRVKYVRIEDQCAVLIGGYRDDEAAARALKDVRKWPPPNPQRVRLASKFFTYNDPQTGQQGADQVYVNPFHTAIVVRNPSIKVQHQDGSKLDMDLLRKLNAAEPHSLLKCPKNYTLMVKQFQMPMAVQSKSAAGKFFENLGLGKSSDQRVDTAAENAHNLAELFRKRQPPIEAYVLHTQYYSLVTVGGFDRPDELRLQSTLHMLRESLKIPHIVPMPVPGRDARETK